MSAPSYFGIAGCLLAESAKRERMAARAEHWHWVRQNMPIGGLKPRRTKCDSCGSREFKEHHGQSVCIYCRGTA